MGISRNEALDCFRSDDLIGIGMEADAVRRRLHPEGVVSYVIDGRVTYTESAAGAGFDQLCEKISDIAARGGHGVMLQGEGNPIDRRTIRSDRTGHNRTPPRRRTRLNPR